MLVSVRTSVILNFLYKINHSYSTEYKNNFLLLQRNPGGRLGGAPQEPTRRFRITNFFDKILFNIINP